MKDNEFNFEEDDLEDELEVEEEDEEVNDEIDEPHEKEPLFDFNKFPYQEKGENLEDMGEYEMGTDQELMLGESEKRQKRRTLGEERGAGHEP